MWLTSLVRLSSNTTWISFTIRLWYAFEKNIFAILVTLIVTMLTSGGEWPWSYRPSAWKWWRPTTNSEAKRWTCKLVLRHTILRRSAHINRMCLQVKTKVVQRRALFSRSGCVTPCCSQDHPLSQTSYHSDAHPSHQDKELVFVTQQDATYGI